MVPIIIDFLVIGVNYVDEPVSEEKKPQVVIDQQLKKVIPHAYSIGDMDVYIGCW